MTTPSSHPVNHDLLMTQILEGMFTIKKDEWSDNYAVALQYSEKDTHYSRVEIAHYGSDHKEINHINVIPTEGYEAIRILDINVRENSDVYFCLGAYLKQTDPKNGKLLVGSVRKGQNVAQIKTLEFGNNKDLETCMLLYNPKEKNLILTTLIETDSKKTIKYISSYITVIDASDLGIVFHKSIETPNIDDAYKTIFGDKKSFTGVPQTMYINDDGTYTIVFQMIEPYGSLIYLSHVAVAVFNNELKEINSYLVPMKQTVTSSLVSFYLYISKNHSKSVLLFDNGLEYLVADYADAPEGKYIFFNDLIQNEKNIERGSVAPVKDVSNADAYVCSLKDNKVEKSLLFGTPDKGHNYIMISANNYSKETGYLATLKHEYKKGSEHKMVWIKLK